MLPGRWYLNPSFRVHVANLGVRVATQALAFKSEGLRASGARLLPGCWYLNPSVRVRVANLGGQVTTWALAFKSCPRACC